MGAAEEDAAQVVVIVVVAVELDMICYIQFETRLIPER